MSRNLFDEVKSLATEQRNPASLSMDEMDSEGILRLINSEDAKVADAVGAEIPHISIVTDELVKRIKAGGRLFYVGAGTSGRMGIVDAAECPPTFGTPQDLVQAIIAGGDKAVFRAQEGAEDVHERGAQAIEQNGVTASDMVIGIAASKRTPFVLGALERSFKIQAYTVLLTTNPRESLHFDFLSETICPVVGPEVLMGSTRMKSALAQKMVLTMITTTAMVRLGKVYENMMVDLQLTNKKLEERAKRIVMIATECDYEQAQRVLAEANGHVKSAIIMQKGSVSFAEAQQVLAQAGGFVKQALRLLQAR